MAERKVRVLLDCGACVCVVSPAITDGLQALVEEAKVEWTARPYEHGDLAGAFCTFAATDDHGVNLAVFEEATHNSQLCNVVDVPPLCNFIVPSIVNRGELSIAISTSGNSPALAKRMRRDLEEHIGPEWERLNDLMGRLRPELKRRYPEEAPRNDILARMIEAGVLELLSEGRDMEAEELAWRCI